MLIPAERNIQNLDASSPAKAVRLLARVFMRMPPGTPGTEDTYHGPGQDQQYSAQGSFCRKPK